MVPVLSSPLPPTQQVCGRLANWESVLEEARRRPDLTLPGQGALLSETVTVPGDGQYSQAARPWLP